VPETIDGRFEDGQIRQIGFGDLVVGKQVGRMMSALGGCLAAYRVAVAPEAEPGALGEGLVRSLYRGASPAPASMRRAQSHPMWLAGNRKVGFRSVRPAAAHGATGRFCRSVGYRTFARLSPRARSRSRR